MALEIFHIEENKSQSFLFLKTRGKKTERMEYLLQGLSCSLVEINAGIDDLSKKKDLFLISSSYTNKLASWTTLI